MPYKQKHHLCSRNSTRHIGADSYHQLRVAYKNLNNAGGQTLKNPPINRLTTYKHGYVGGPHTKNVVNYSAHLSAIRYAACIIHPNASNMPAQPLSPASPHPEPALCYRHAAAKVRANPLAYKQPGAAPPARQTCTSISPVMPFCHQSMWQNVMYACRWFQLSGYAESGSYLHQPSLTTCVLHRNPHGGAVHVQRLLTVFTPQYFFK